MNIPQFLTDDEDFATCIMRVRYNITQDIDGWETEQLITPGVDFLDNADPVDKNAANRMSLLPMWEEYGFTSDDEEVSACMGIQLRNNNDDDERVKCREYVHVDNPRVDPIGQVVGDGDNEFRLKLQLAINTAQYGRTFQDRSHTFRIQKNPLPDNKVLKLVTMGGKRGNIVQTFPGTEYFVYPETTNVRIGDYLHFGWTGSNTNPNNNDGQGKQGTDRSNLAPMKSANYEGGETTENGEEENLGSLLNSYPAYVSEPLDYALPQVDTCKGSRPDNVAPRVAGFSLEIAEQLAVGRQVHEEGLDMGNMEELDDAATSFSLLPQEVLELGCWSMVSTRNNNFSNRSQKGTICVNEGDTYEQDIGVGGKTMKTRQGWLQFEQGALMGIQQIRYESHPKKDSASELHEIDPLILNLDAGKTANIGIAYDSTSFGSPQLMHRQSGDQEWAEMDATFKEEDGMNVAVADINEGGWYKVEEEPDASAIAAIVVAGVCFIGVSCFMGWYSWSKSE